MGRSPLMGMHGYTPDDAASDAVLLREAPDDAARAPSGLRRLFGADLTARRKAHDRAQGGHEKPPTPRCPRSGGHGVEHHDPGPGPCWPWSVDHRRALAGARSLRHADGAPHVARVRLAACGLGLGQAVLRYFPTARARGDRTLALRLVRWTLLPHCSPGRGACAHVAAGRLDRAGLLPGHGVVLPARRRAPRRGTGVRGGTNLATSFYDSRILSVVTLGSA